eukprot:Protomagalhaensia_sp_Gyna_25__713@NODE_1335_length_1935_cov_425_004747_g1067_i0_p1_GENE_NODE_1335_length_1935_cov_425_004747_g1067_i0NODE_1335_length_1935_cov_425_004747_g1067_i0_p1_ORF_typecomplete_len306_score51_96FKBP_C/PF00254_28/3_9e03FKBP_C/PF00254_28/2_5e20CDC27/PF09507_10/0_58Mucin/PF01456_17/1_9FAP/PF07174_11/2_3_NODE_1335_length_1935_cov_425_004747_g1067_i09901907
MNCFAETIRPGAAFSWEGGIITVKCMATEAAGKLLAKPRGAEEFHTIAIFNDQTPSTIPVDLAFCECVSFMAVDCEVHIAGYVMELPDDSTECSSDDEQEVTVVAAPSAKPTSPSPAKNASEDAEPKPTAVKKQVPKEAPKSKVVKQKAEQQPKHADEGKANAKKPAQTKTVEPSKSVSEKKPEGVEQSQSDGVKPGVKKRLSNGVTYEILKVGSPKGLAKRGVHAVVGYEGRLRNGVLFDKGELTMRVGAGEVVPGFEAGVEGMLLGEKRQLLIPARLGYGPRRMGKIPPNSDLLFTVTLRNVQ